MTDALRHQVPTHILTPDGVEGLSLRQMALLVGTTFTIAPAFALLTPAVGPSIGDFVVSAVPIVAGVLDPGALPLAPTLATATAIVAAGVAAIPFDPPVEHGLISWARYRTRPRLLGPDDIDSLIGNPTVTRDSARVHGRHLAMWEMPSVSMRLASDAARNVARARWAAFLDGLPCPIQTMTRCTPVNLRSVLDTMAKHANPNGRAIARHLMASTAAGGEVQRRRFLSINADSESGLERWATDIEGGLARATLRGRRLADEELADVLHGAWSTKPRRKGRIGPSTVRVESEGVHADGQWIATQALQRWPSTVMMDFLAPVYDDAWPIDVMQSIRPVDTVSIKRRLRDRLSRLETTKQTRERKLAIKQLDDMLDQLEQNRERIFDVDIVLLVRADSRGLLDNQVRRVEQTVEELGGLANRLRWEHPDGVVAASGSGAVNLLQRNHLVDSSSISRAFPMGASELALDGGVPWGVTQFGNRRVVWTPWARPIVPNPHIALYCTSGGGKGFTMKVFSARAIFAGVFDEVFFTDQAEESEDGEYGRWARYVGGRVIKLHRDSWETEVVRELAGFATGKLPCAVVLNTAELGQEARCRSMSAFKRAVFDRASRVRARRLFGVDEIWTYADERDASGREAAGELEDAWRRGRHVKIACASLTQRPMDALESRLGRIIQSISGTIWYGMQSPGEISDVAHRLRWTDEQVAAIERFGPGDGMLTVGGLHRIAFTVDYSPEEWQMAQTDSVVETPAAAYTAPEEGVHADAVRSDPFPAGAHAAPSRSDAGSDCGVPAGNSLDIEAPRRLVELAAD